MLYNIIKIYIVEENMKINSDDYITNTAISTTEIILKSMWDVVSKYFKSLKAQESILYGNAYEKYLINTRVKNSKIKTLIYKQVPKDLYSFYECVGVKYNGKQWDTKSLNNLLQIGNKNNNKRKWWNRQNHTIKAFIFKLHKRNRLYTRFNRVKKNKYDFY